MKRFSWIISLPLMIVFIALALANRHEITLYIWPFDYEVAFPMALFGLVFVFAGILIGGVAAWLAAGKTRRRVRDERRAKHEAQLELIDMKKAEADKAGSGAGKALLPIKRPAA